MRIRNCVCAAVVCLATALTGVTAADSAAEMPEIAETEVVTEESGNGKLVGGVLMLGAVFAASWVSMLIFRGRDNTKYL